MVILYLMLSGCAVDNLRLSTARDFNTQADTVAARGDEYLAGVQQRRREADVALVASDPSCTWGPTLWVRDVWTAPRAGHLPDNLCGNANVAGFHEVPLTPVNGSPLTSQLAALALYQEALTNIVGKDEASASTAVSDAITTITGIASDVSRIRQQTLISGATIDQINASANLLDTLVTMRDTHLEEIKVRKAVAGFDAAGFFRSMRRAIGKIDRLYDQGSQLRLQAALDRISALEALRPRSPSDDSTIFYVARRDLVSAIATARDERAGLHARTAPLNQAVDKLEALDGDLRRQLAGKLTKAERKNVREKNRKQLLDVLGQVAALFPAI